MHNLPRTALPLRGRVREGGGVIGTARVATPLPHPPPQGGREPTARFAEVETFTEASHLPVMQRHRLLRSARNDGERAPRPLFRRGVPPRSSDEPGRIAEPLNHHSGDILGLAGDAGAGAHGVAVLMFDV